MLYYEFKDDSKKDGGSIPAPQPSSSDPHTSLSETKKTKKDHVDEKLGTKGKKEGKQRAPSPELKGSTMGSAVSLRSNTSRASRGLCLLLWQRKQTENKKFVAQLSFARKSFSIC